LASSVNRRRRADRSAGFARVCPPALPYRARGGDRMDHVRAGVRPPGVPRRPLSRRCVAAAPAAFGQHGHADRPRTSTAFGYQPGPAPRWPRARSPFVYGRRIILTLITLGKFLEARSKGTASAAIERLLDLSPRTARVIREGCEIDVPLAEVTKGERVRVRPGESVPSTAAWSRGIRGRREHAQWRVVARPQANPATAWPGPPATATARS